MIVYNLSIKVNYDISEKWVEWQTKEHIPAIMATSLFTHYKFFKLLDHDDEEGITYIIQYFTGTKENYQRYIKDFDSFFIGKEIAKWDDRFIVFRSLMETVQ